MTDYISKYRALSDAQLIKRLCKQLESVEQHQPIQALAASTLHEYSKTMQLMAAQLSEDFSGQPRHCLPAYVEILLRPNGPAFAAAQLFPDAADRRRVATCMASVVNRCFPNLEQTDRERALKAWRGMLCGARRQYLKARAENGGFGGAFLPEQLVSAAEISNTIASHPQGSAERLVLYLFRRLVSKLPTQYQVISRLLNMGHIRIVLADTAPTIDSWVAEVRADDNREAGLLLVTAENRPVALYFLIDSDASGPVGCRFCVTGDEAEVELSAYLSTLPAGQPWLFSHAKGGLMKCEKPYSGPAGRDAWNSRVNRMLQKVFGTREGGPVTQLIYRLSLVHATRQEQNRHQAASYAQPVHAANPAACV